MNFIQKIKESEAESGTEPDIGRLKGARPPSEERRKIILDMIDMVSSTLTSLVTTKCHVLSHET